MAKLRWDKIVREYDEDGNCRSSPQPKSWAYCFAVLTVIVAALFALISPECTLSTINPLCPRPVNITASFAPFWTAYTHILDPTLTATILQNLHAADSTITTHRHALDSPLGGIDASTTNKPRPYITAKIDSLLAQRTDTRQDAEANWAEFCAARIAAAETILQHAQAFRATLAGNLRDGNAPSPEKTASGKDEVLQALHSTAAELRRAHGGVDVAFGEAAALLKEAVTVESAIIRAVNRFAKDRPVDDRHVRVVLDAVAGVVGPISRVYRVLLEPRGLLGLGRGELKVNDLDAALVNWEGKLREMRRAVRKLKKQAGFWSWVKEVVREALSGDI